jgi:diketogulonate reductase-like aldo/keto reductase
MQKTSPMGYGTWPYHGKECRTKVEEALKLGYTILDTATYCNNFDGIAAAIQDKKREDLTLISKVWPSDQSPTDLKKDLEATLKK